MLVKVNRAAASALLTLLLLLGFAPASQAQLGISRPKGQQLLDGIVVKVDNQIVLRSDVENIYNQEVARAEGKALPPDLKCKILQSLVLNKLMLARAEVDSVTVTDQQVNGEVDRRMAYFVQQIGSEKRLEEQYNKPLKALKDDLRPQIKDQLTQQKMQETITGKVAVTPREVTQYFSRIPKDSLPYFSTEVEVGQIVMTAQVNDKAKQAAIAKLNDLRAQVLAGADFATLAKANSEDPGSAKEGGYLGFFKRGELVPEYEAASMKLEPGQLSPVVQSQFGFHLIQFIERKGNTYSTRHILLKPEAGAADASAAGKTLTKLRRQILTDSISFAKAAKDNSTDKTSSGNGGLLANRQVRLAPAPRQARPGYLLHHRHHEGGPHYPAHGLPHRRWQGCHAHSVAEIEHPAPPGQPAGRLPEDCRRRPQREEKQGARRVVCQEPGHGVPGSGPRICPVQGAGRGRQVTCAQIDVGLSGA